MNPEFALLGLGIFGLAFCGVCFIGFMSRRRGPPTTQGADVDAVHVGVFSGDMRGATSTQVQRAAAFAKLDYFTLEKPMDDSSLGVDLKISGQMALVLKVAEGSLSEAAGLQPGLRIYTVNGRACDGADHCAELLRGAPAGSVRIGTARIIVADSFDAAVDELKHGGEVGVRVSASWRDPDNAVLAGLDSRLLCGHHNMLRSDAPKARRVRGGAAERPSGAARDDGVPHREGEAAAMAVQFIDGPQLSIRHGRLGGERLPPDHDGSRAPQDIL